MRAVKLKLAILGLLTFGWCLASGTISVKIQVANGPVRPLNHDLVAKKMLMIKGFGISILHLTVGAVRVDSALRSGRAVELASENILACAVLVFSLVVMTPAALYAIRYIATHDASEILKQPARDIETGLDMIDQECQDAGELAGSNSTHAVAVTPPWLEPLHARPSWMHERQSRRFMARPVCWNESFDAAFLGVVTEAEVLGSGFGGVVRAGIVGEHQIASKELHRDDEDEEMFKEVYVGLLVPASPYMGVAQTSEGAPRLISARLPETVAEFLARAVWPFDVRVQLAIGMLEAVEQVAHLGLVHCDIKPSNFMLDEKLNVYIIDFGAVTLEGGLPPMSCQLYAPPDQIVTLSWEVFSMGRVFSEIFDVDVAQATRTAEDTAAPLDKLVPRMCSGLVSERPSLHECLSVLRVQQHVSMLR